MSIVDVAPPPGNQGEKRETEGKRRPSEAAGGFPQKRRDF
jgi:hypothetical protein